MDRVHMQQEVDGEVQHLLTSTDGAAEWEQSGWSVCDPPAPATTLSRATAEKES